jgi:diacylglycerol kinase (ATP)
MRYAIVANPASGKMTIEQKRSALARAADILKAEIHGLDTKTSEEFRQCVRELATGCDVLVTAGGDGTISDVINAVDTRQIPIAYLPLGTGNSMRYALGYRGSLAGISMRIRDGKIREYDLIGCGENRRAFMTSIGIDGTVIQLRDRYLSLGVTGFRAYLQSTLKAYFKAFRRVIARVAVDERRFEIRNLLSLLVVKQPYYGFAMKIVPGARWDDGQLHLLCVNSGLLVSLFGVMTAFTIGNRVGDYHTARRVAVELERPLVQQIDGSDAREADSYAFRVLPNALKLKC